jgi:hypothetical protein
LKSQGYESDSELVIVVLEDGKAYKITIKDENTIITYEKVPFELGIEGKIIKVHSQLKTYQHHILEVEPL